MSQFIKIHDFSKGLWLPSPEEEAPLGSLVRARGVHPLMQKAVRSRFGSTELHDVNAHSIFYFNASWYYGVTTSFYIGGGTGYEDTIKTGLGGARLAAAIMGPIAGLPDRLFIAGGEELFKVDDTLSLVNDSYAWTESGSGTNEYYLITASDTDPNLNEPDALNFGGVILTPGTVGSLSALEWDWGDNDSLGFNTVYVRLMLGYEDPSDLDDDGIKAVYAHNWGITPPDMTLAAADGGAGGELDDGAVYKYRLTYYNANTGVRSNPTEAASGTAPDEYTVLLLHCDGADASTTFTDSGIGSRTVTANGDAQLDTAQKVFGTASGLFDGTGDYLSIAPSATYFFFGTNPFTIDFRARFNSLPSTNNSMYFFSNYATSTTFVSVFIRNNGGDIDLQASIKVSGDFLSLRKAASGIVVDTWYHIALIRGWGGDDNVWALTLDGTAVATGTKAVSHNYTFAIEIGRRTSPAGSYLDGWLDEYRISKGIARWTEDFTPPAYAYGTAAVDLIGGSTSVDLSNIPESDDPQVTDVEIWRTQGGDTAYFFLARITNGTATYTDDMSDDDLSSIELPTDNLKPYSWFDDCYGPHNASMFWITRTQVGERGRLYYSPIGRAESVEGFINVSRDSLGLQKIFGWRGYLGVVGKDGIYDILGTNPYQAKKVSGAPGTSLPHTAVVTPIGLVYEANDGVRVYDGSASRLLGFDAVGKIFRGISAGDLTSFTGAVAAYARNEYFISDGSQTLALNLNNNRWRDLGVGLNGVCYAEADDLLAATISSKVYKFELEGTTQDGTTDIPFIVEPASVCLSETKKTMVQHIHVDAEINSETLGVYLVYDNGIILVGYLTTGSYRLMTSLPVGKLVHNAGVKISGTLDDTVEIYGIILEID